MEPMAQIFKLWGSSSRPSHGEVEKQAVEEAAPVS